MFGVPLSEAWAASCLHVPGTSQSAVRVPVVVRVCIDYVVENGIQLEGIYRISPTKQRMDELRARVDAGQSTADDEMLVLGFANL